MIARISLIAFLFWFASFSLAAAETIARLVQGQGDVVRVRDGVSEPLTAGAALRESDHLLTGVDARATLMFLDGTQLLVGPETELALSRYATGVSGRRSGGVVSVVEGIVRLLVQPGLPGSVLDVQGRSAIASVRATELIVQCEEGHVAFFVADGNVDVRRIGDGAILQLGAGDGVDLLDDRPLPEVVQWGAGRVAEAMALTSPRGSPIGRTP